MAHLAAKAWYLSFFGSHSMIYPYMNLYYRRLGFNERAVGVLAGMKPWVFGPAGYIGAAFADKYRKHRVVLIVTLIISIVCKTLIGYSHAYWLLIALVALSEIFGAPNLTIADAAILAMCKEDGSFGRQRLWGAIGWGINSFVMGGLITLFGIMTPFVVFPIVSIFTIIAGCSLDVSLLTSPDDAPKGDAVEEVELCPTDAKRKGAQFTLESSSDENDGQSIAVVVTSPEDSCHSGLQGSSKSDTESTAGENELEEAALLPGKGISKDTDTKPPSTDTRKGGDASFLSKLARVLTKQEVLIFVAMAFLMGIGAGTIENFLFLYLDQLGAPEYLMGLSLTVTCSAEVPVFFAMDHILRILGIQNTLHMVLGVFILRLLSYALLASLGSPWWVLAIEPLHGVTFGCAWGAGTEYSRKIAPPGLDATLQAVFAGMYFGFGYGTGALLGGAVFNAYGPRIMFLLMAAILSTGWGICLCVIGTSAGMGRAKYQVLQG